MKMRFGWALASAMLVGSFGSAYAADMALKAPLMAPAPIWTWTGFYIGGNIGYGFGRTATDATANLAGIPPIVAIDTRPMDGIVGGGQIGWNLQVSSWVIGVESDFQGAGQHLATTINTPFFAVVGPFVGVGNQIQSRDERLDWFGTVRGRIGYAAENVLFYGTGGLAYGHLSYSGSDSFPFTIVGLGLSAAPTGSFNAGTNKLGWTVGGGVEGAIMRSNWSWKVEYLHMDLGRTNYAFVATGLGAAAVPVTGNARFTDDIVRVGLNYRLNGPVVARF
jgi:outer membrane immunogenic protein